MNTIINIVFILCFCLSSTAFSFAKDKHAGPTKHAFALYVECQHHYPETLTYTFSDADMATVVKANMRVDSPSFSRLRNWHFYDARYDYKRNKPGYIRKNILGINRSLHRYYLVLLDNLKTSMDGSNNKRLLKNVGVVMHFVQDMAVPAHVAAIYHGPLNKDSFDEYEPKTKPVVSLSKAECKHFIDHIDAPLLILEKLAKNTLAEMRSNINESLSWADFWNIYPKTNPSAKSGFSVYGRCGNKAFGDTEHAVCKVKQEQYDAFYNARYLAAVTSSLRLLLYTFSAKQQ